MIRSGFRFGSFSIWSAPIAGDVKFESHRTGREHLSHQECISCIVLNQKDMNRLHVAGLTNGHRGKFRIFTGM